MRPIKFHPTDKPWITPTIKLLINERQRAFHSGNVHQWRHYRYKVQREMVAREKKFYAEKVKKLLTNDCRGWWKLINTMSGRSKSKSNFSLQRDGKQLTDNELANSLNMFFVSVNADIPPLNLNHLPTYLPAAEEVPVIQHHEVCSKLLKPQSSKASGPDNIPPRILKEFAYVLTEPITAIFNALLSSGFVPALWKDSNTTPIPKIPQPTCEGDTRPISLTACTSKVLKDFVVKWMIEDVGDKIGPNQFGALKETSTTFCLLDMFHQWLSSIDPQGYHSRICFLDFSKAFDPNWVQCPYWEANSDRCEKMPDPIDN